MKIRIAVVGRLKERYLRDAEAEYLKRLRPYARVEVGEYASEKALLSALPDGARLYALDERGSQPSSEEFARAILGEEEMRGGGALVVFAIGGADGHSDAVRQRAAGVIAFGRMTVAHRLMRVLLLEQIYRGYRILRGEPYHRE